MSRALAVCLLLGGCAGEPEALTFPTPWEEADPSVESIRGSFSAVLDSELPGAGSFAARDFEGHDFSRARVHDVGATWPVIAVEILGRDGDGYNRLELDIALNHWVAGEISVDGTAAVGLLTRADGDAWYVTGGRLTVIQPGVEPGQRVEARFTELDISEAP